MAIVAKRDIEILTKQLVHEKRRILETIRNEYIEIDPALLHQNIVQELEEKINKVNKPIESPDEPSISLDDCEAIFGRFDALDKQLAEPKPVLPPPNVRKENQSGMKRYGSMTDMNKSLTRFVSSSTQNLNSTRTFVEPCTPAPRMPHNHSVHTSHELVNAMPKLTTEEIINHNQIKEDVELRLESKQNDSNNYKQVFSDICQTYKSSFERLNRFFAEVQKIQSNKSANPKNEVSFTGLDHDLLHLMDKLNKALSQIRFIVESQNIYNAAGIKAFDSLLSDDLTDILEYFYRTVK